MRRSDSHGGFRGRRGRSSRGSSDLSRLARRAGPRPSSSIGMRTGIEDAMSPTHHRLLFWAILGMSLSPARADEPPRPQIRKLGTLDLDMVEATPIVFRDRLYRFEYVRKDYTPNPTDRKSTRLN